MKKFNLQNWTYDNTKLANPFIIVKRLICYVLMWLFAIPLYIVCWIGWGKNAADEILEMLT